MDALDHIIKNIKERTYQLIGQGSGRIVYDIGNGYVAKVAKNRKGFAQNRVEHQIYSENHSDFFAKITIVSDDYKILIMEKGNKIYKLSAVCRFYGVSNYRELFHIKELYDIIIKYNLLTPDLCRPSSWGIVNEKPVIIDYGFTKEVRKKYYPVF